MLHPGKLDTFVIMEKNSVELNLANEVWNVTAIFSQTEIAIREMIAWNYEWIQQIKAETGLAGVCMVWG